MSSQLNVAIVHDGLVNSGGAERTLTFMCEAFPQATVFTSVYLSDQTFPDFKNQKIHTLPGAHWVRTERKTKQMLPLWIMGFQQLDLSSFDVVLSSTTWSAKFVRHSHHACYCYAPFRWLWKPGVYTQQSLPINPFLSKALAFAHPVLRQFDYAAMQRVTSVATSCQNMASEIEVCYHRHAEVIYPPIRISDYCVGSGPGEYFLTVSRLISHKRVDLAINACEILGQNLVVVGDGPELASLQRMAGSRIKFAGRVSDVALRKLYTDCRAVLFPSHEDYGIVPLEAQASGRPVIAYGVGGVRETVLEGVSGIFFADQTVDAVISAIQAFERIDFDPRKVRRIIERFDAGSFKQTLREFVLRT